MKLCLRHAAPAAALAILSGCSASSPDPAPAPLHVAHAIPRLGASTASIATLPNATCTLRPASEPAGARAHVTFFSDAEGVVRVHLRHVDAGTDHAPLALDCVDDAGKRVTHAIDVTVSADATPQAPARATLAGAPTLPALDVDPASLATEDLVARHYPPRPDARTAPTAYTKWLDLVTSGARVVTPRLVARPDRAHGPARVANGNGTSNNWSGYVISTPASASQYAEVFGLWSVPRAYAEPGFWYLNHSSFWVGIDGWGTPDVVQAGTDQDTETIFGVQASTYDAWTEWYPLSSQTIAGFPVSPGDQIECWVWVGNASGAYSPTGGIGWFYVWNTTQNVVAAYLHTAAPSGTTFNGHQAEWVMERPTVNGSLSTLANYSSATMSDVWAYDFAGREHPYTSDTSTALTMTNGSKVLSTVAPLNAWAMQFTWHAYD
jgi:hypothetical protein